MTTRLPSNTHGRQATCLVGPAPRTSARASAAAAQSNGASERIITVPANEQLPSPDAAAGSARTASNAQASTAQPDFTNSLEGSKLRLLNLCAGTDRGAETTLARRRHIKRAIERVLEHSEAVDLAAKAPAAIDGQWELLYSTCEQFRSSPFFWAFQQGLVQDIDIAGAIFAFTDSIPGAQIGQAVQKIDMAAGEGDTLQLEVQSTAVPDSNLFPFLDNVAVPVQQIFERLRGSGAASVEARVLACDDTMRITRTADNQMFVYARLQ